jgi:hypothetical protein
MHETPVKTGVSAFCDRGITTKIAVPLLAASFPCGTHALARKGVKSGYKLETLFGDFPAPTQREIRVMLFLHGYRLPKSP